MKQIIYAMQFKGQGGPGGFAHHLFDTHPPIEQRIATLQAMLQVKET